MGYTHYWGFSANTKDIKDGAAKFAEAVKLSKKCIAKIPKKSGNTEGEEMEFKLAGWDGTGRPVFNDNVISFNGTSKNSEGEDDSYESFIIGYGDTEWKFSFCKTGRRPYDVAVCISLLCFKHIFGKDFHYSSDGDLSDFGWKKAHEVLGSVIGKKKATFKKEVS